jgi:hypothetical protein
VGAQLFVQPGRSLIEGAFPRIENVASVSGYKEGLSGAVNPTYLADALEISSQFGSIRFFTRDQDSPLMFVYGGLDDWNASAGSPRCATRSIRCRCGSRDAWNRRRWKKCDDRGNEADATDRCSGSRTICAGWHAQDDQPCICLLRPRA